MPDLDMWKIDKDEVHDVPGTADLPPSAEHVYCGKNCIETMDTLANIYTQHDPYGSIGESNMVLHREHIDAIERCINSNGEDSKTGEQEANEFIVAAREVMSKEPDKALVVGVWY